MGKKCHCSPRARRSAAKIFPEVAQVRLLSSYTFTRDYLVRPGAHNPWTKISRHFFFTLIDADVIGNTYFSREKLI